jgi:hypothetical protein
MLRVQVKERGPVPRRLKAHYTQVSRESWRETGIAFHTTYRPRRFTTAHARAAGYAPRAGENLPYGSKAYWASYIGRKKRRFGHVRPLEWSGESRRAVQTANLVVTSNQVKVKYRGARVFNFRGLNEEFTRLLPAEAVQLGRVYDRNLTKRFGKGK